MASSISAADTTGLDTLPLYKRLLYKNESDRTKYEKAVQTCLAAEAERSQKNMSMTNGAAAKSNGSKASPSVKAKKTLVKKSAPPAKAGAKRKMVQSDDDDDDDSSSSSEDDDSESDSEDDDDDSEDEKPLASRKKNTKTTPTPPAKKAKKAAASSAGKKAKKKNASSSGVGIEKTTSTKAKVWDTLSHSGVLFPPQYEPHGISVRYSGQEVKLTPEQEEVATWYAQMIHTNSDYIGKELFQKNFWDGFKKILGKNHVIKELSKIDFAPIVEHLEAQREVKKAMTNEQKKELKAKKDAMEAPFLFAMLNGTREKVGNFRVEPPGLFRGRGEHPKMGMLKRRMEPEDVIINIGKDAPIPTPFTHTADFQLVELKGRHWQEIRHDPFCAWMAGWHDSINTKDWKYVQFAATSSVKGESDLKKYEKARKLCLYIDKIRKDYEKGMKSSDPETAQLAVTTYLVDKLALRAGGEKEEDLADTVGVTTLRVSHVELHEDGETITFDFLGKDSIRFHQTHKLNPVAVSAMKRFMKMPREKTYERGGKTFAAGSKKGPDDDIFGHVDPSKVNEHLANLVPELRPTIKTFRTYNASILIDEMLQEFETDQFVAQAKNKSESVLVDAKVAYYNNANKEVAILCNHQKGVSKDFDSQMGKKVEKRDSIKEKIAELKKQKDLAADKKAAKMKALNDQLAKAETAMRQKEDLKTVSLGTSKINYMDPRITIAFCKRAHVPIEKCFNKALLEKFNWAMEESPEFRFDPAVDPVSRMQQD